MTALSINEADQKARAWVNGMIQDPKQGWIPHTAHWHSRFRRHPWVEEADRDGWGRELRGAVIMATKLKILRGEDYSEVGSLMPPLWWVEQQRANALRFKEAAESRARLIEQYGTLDKALEVINRQSVNAGASKTSTFRKVEVSVPEPRAYKEDA